MTDERAATPLRRFSEAVVDGLLRAVWGIRVSGLESVPSSGPVIIAGNHTSLLDPPLLCVALSKRRYPRGMGKKELFENPAMGWMLRQLGGFPVDRSGADLSALREALGILQRGESLMLFPEGTRVKPGQKLEPKTGIAFLSAKAAAPVVPVRLVGASDFPKTFPLEVRFGRPLPPPAKGKDEAAEFARRVMDAVYSL